MPKIDGSLFIEDETVQGYTIRTDLMKNGDIIECRDDPDMCIKKEGDEILLVKKSYSSHPFRK